MDDLTRRPSRYNYFNKIMGNFPMTLDKILSYDLGQDTFNNEVDKVLLKKMKQTKIIIRKGCSVTVKQDLIN